MLNAKTIRHIVFEEQKCRVLLYLWNNKFVGQTFRNYTLCKTVSPNKGGGVSYKINQLYLYSRVSNTTFFFLAKVSKNTLKYMLQYYYNVLN